MEINRHDKEKKIFSCFERESAETVFNVRVAGETYPDPYYYFERDEEQLSFNEYTCKTGVYVLEYIKSGKGYIESDGKKYTVQAGDFYLLSPMAPHRYYSDSKDPFNKLFVNLTGTLVSGMVNGLRINTPVRIMHKDISKDMEFIHGTLAREDISLSEKHDIVAARVCSILLLLKPQPKKSNSPNELALVIRQYINENLSSDIDLESICKYFYISKSSLILMFQKEFGVTPHKYIIEKRIDAAKRLLKNDDLTISDIARRVGFDGEKYFYSAFKKVTLTTPGNYRSFVRIQNGAGEEKDN